MNSLQKRIASFDNNLVKWPHNENSKFPKPITFARAGFYFARRPVALDTVRCFTCNVELSYWKPGQSPFKRHTLASPNCAWKLLNFPDAHKVSLSKNCKANGGPRGKTMYNARLATFNSRNQHWILKKDLSVNPAAATKLAKAGFFFSPTAENPLRVKCAYCGVTLDTPSDSLDVMREHQKLSNECVYFECTNSKKETINVIDSQCTSGTTKSTLKNNQDSNTGSTTLKRGISKVSSSSDTYLYELSTKRQKCGPETSNKKITTEDIKLSNTGSTINAATKRKDSPLSFSSSTEAETDASPSKRLRLSTGENEVNTDDEQHTLPNTVSASPRPSPERSTVQEKEVEEEEKEKEVKVEEKEKEAEEEEKEKQKEAEEEEKEKQKEVEEEEKENEVEEEEKVKVRAREEEQEKEEEKPITIPKSWLRRPPLTIERVKCLR